MKPKKPRFDKSSLRWEKLADNPCDRCGNKTHDYGSLYFPASKTRVYLCDICFFGLSLGLKFDIERLMHDKIKESHNLLGGEK